MKSSLPPSACGDPSVILWTTPSPDASGSMPLGNGDIALNVWFDPQGILHAYVAKGDAWGEFGQLYKLGKIAVELLDPLGEPLIRTTNFRWSLDLDTASITINSRNVRVRIWVDANSPQVHFTVAHRNLFQASVHIEPWRNVRREITGQESHGLHMGAPYPVYHEADEILDLEGEQIGWLHQNRSSTWQANLARQGLTDSIQQSQDPLLHRCFGAILHGENLHRSGETKLSSIVTNGEVSFSLTALTMICEERKTWIAACQNLVKQAAPAGDDSAWEAHCDWWEAFWQRSWMRLDGNEAARKISQGYRLQRFMNACAGRSAYPIKFNGSLFTVPWNYPGEAFDADYRRWGPGYWHQNTRLPYWSMLYSGDFEMMRPYFEMYVNALPLATERCERHCGHTGAFFLETMYFWGAYLEHNYGWEGIRDADLPAHLPQNPYIRLHNSSGLEVLYLALLAHRFSGDISFLKNYAQVLAEPLIAYYDHHFPRVEGKLHIAPAQVIEQWWTATGPMPEIAGLHACLELLLALPSGTFPAERFEQWQRLRSELPALPVVDQAGKRVFAPAQAWEGPPRNTENPELYAVFPYHRCHVDSPDLAVGIETFHRRAHTHDKGWAQDGMQAALLGLTPQARNSVEQRLTTPSPYARFPAFWGPGFDWIPDQDQGGSAAHALQLMAIQVIARRVHLLPAWPPEWALDARFAVPGSGRVRITYQPGQPAAYAVTGTPDPALEFVLHQPARV